MRSPLPTIISNRGDFADGTAVIADRQTAGKGRQGKSWSEAPVGQAMYLSVLFHSMKISDMGLLPFYAVWPPPAV